MIGIDKIDFAKMKEMVKALNELGVLAENLKVIGVSKEALAQSFGDAIDALDEAGAAKLTPEMIEHYNFLFGDEVEPEPEAAAPAAAPAPGAKPAKPAKPGAKPAKPAKEPKPPKERKPSSIEKGIFGSVKGSKSCEMDDAVAAGTTIQQMVEKLGVSASRAANHIKYIEANRGVKIEKTIQTVDGKEVEFFKGTKA